jgi:hypothetical protein
MPEVRGVRRPDPAPVMHDMRRGVFMITHDVLQGTTEWLAVRAGITS